jgi:aminoglycoside phosphotransferase (APT) family kinase protein
MPAALRQSSDEELRRSLEQALAGALGRPPTVGGLRRQPFAYETSFAIDELEVRLSDGQELDLLVKDVGAAGLSASAKAAKPARSLDPRREIAVYRSLLQDSAVPAPRFYGSDEDGTSGRAWLFLERVPGEVLADVGDPEAWRAAARWAAKLGAAVQARQHPTLDPLLLNRDRGWHEHWIAAAVSSCEGSGRDELAARLRRCESTFLDRVDGLPRAFVHGELYASNVLVQREGLESGQVKPVDWEMAGPGPFALDLAAILTGWEGEAREAMHAAFWEALPDELGSAISGDDLRDAVALCELTLALQWLGWASSWQAPAEHRRDWATEAARLLEETGL